MALDPQCMKLNFNSLISFVIELALLLLSVTVQGQVELLKLRNLLEEGLVNRSENVNLLQQVYFNPSSVYSPTSVCLKVIVIVDIIRNEPAELCDSVSGYNTDYGLRPAFKSYRHTSFSPESCTSGWYFASSYILKLADTDYEDDTSQLSDSLTTSGSTGVFYAFDPTFYNIIKALSVSITLSFPYLTENETPSVQSGADNIVIHISDLQNMLCWSYVDFELRMVLVWVSINKYFLFKTLLKQFIIHAGQSICKSRWTIKH